MLWLNGDDKSMQNQSNKVKHLQVSVNGFDIGSIAYTSIDKVNVSGTKYHKYVLGLDGQTVATFDIGRLAELKESKNELTCTLIPDTSLVYNCADTIYNTLQLIKRGHTLDREAWHNPERDDHAEVVEYLENVTDQIKEIVAIIYNMATTEELIVVPDLMACYAELITALAYPDACTTKRLELMLEDAEER